MRCASFNRHALFPIQHCNVFFFTLLAVLALDLSKTMSKIRLVSQLPGLIPMKPSTSSIKQYPLVQGRSPLQGCPQGVWAQQRVPGGGAVQERPGAAGQTAWGGGGQQQFAQRPQSVPLRGPGLRPAGERQTHFLYNTAFHQFGVVLKGLVLNSGTFWLGLVLVWTGRTGRFWSRLVETLALLHPWVCWKVPHQCMLLLLLVTPRVTSCTLFPVDFFFIFWSKVVVVLI